MSRKDIFYGGSVMQLAEEQVGRNLVLRSARPLTFCNC